MLRKNETVAVMIDMQEKLVPAMADKEKLVTNCGLFLEGLSILEVPLLATGQYTKGLGNTIPELKDFFTDQSMIEKITFSSQREPEFVKALEQSGASQVILFGIETHICVEQTALDLIQAGKEVYLIADCVSSRFETDKERALLRMERAGVIITTFEAALFELMERAGSLSFKELSKLVKKRNF